MWVQTSESETSRQQAELDWELGTMHIRLGARDPGHGCRLSSGDGVEFRQAYGLSLVAGRSVPDCQCSTV